MRRWLADPPEGVTIHEDLDGVSLSCSSTRIGSKIGIEVFTVLFLSGVMLPGCLGLGIWLWLSVMQSDTMWVAAVGVLGAFVTTMLSMFLVMFINPLAQRLLETLPGVHRETQVTIGAHTIHLDGELVPLSEVQCVDGDAEPELVLRGGRRVSIGVNAPKESRRWLGRMLGALVSQRVEGSEEDIPKELQRLKHPIKPTQVG